MGVDCKCEAEAARGNNSMGAEGNGEVVKAPIPPSDGTTRETWSKKIDFFLACVGFSIGLGNVWRFPYLCYKNGGGAFLIPYFLCVIVGGVPLFFLEVAVGQFMSESGVRAWRICPILQGIGYASTSLMFFINCYYNVILAWAFYYFFASFTTSLPWDSCDNYWNTPLCSVDFKNRKNATGNIAISTNSSSIQGNYSALLLNRSSSVPYNVTNATTTILLDPTQEFWERKVLNISGGIDEIGGLKWDITLCLILAWIVVYFCIWKGIKSSGKVMYVTATSPYVFMFILLIRGLTLPGAMEGIKFYIIPDFSKLGNMAVWVDAGTQIFFSYSIALGGCAALGSYNKFHHNSFRDSLLFSLTNTCTSIFAGFVIFSNLGFMAHEHGVPVSEVAESGPGLAFIAYPKAVAQMPAAPVWSVMFFLMLILLGLDSQFVDVESVVTSIMDMFPKLRRGYRREVCVAVICLLQCLVGLSMVTNGGMYVFQLMDYYASSKVVLVVACLMCVAIAWIYGVERWTDNLEMMYGFRINMYWKICWTFLSPTFCLVVFIMSIINYTELTYNRPLTTYNYPKWAVVIGWLTAASSAIWIPAIAVYKLISYKVKGKCIRDVLKPENLKPHQLRPQDKQELNINGTEQTKAMISTEFNDAFA